MSFDAMAGYIHELDTDVFAETIPETYQAFLDTLEKHELSTESVALAMDCDDWDVIHDDIPDDAGIEEIENAYKQVTRMFEGRTGVKISLTSIDPGSVYNDVVGPVWCIIEAMDYTPEVKRLGVEHVTQKFFCHFG